MGVLGERPVWSMSGGELLSTLDALEAEIARLESYRLQVVGAMESTGYAAELGARDAAELLRFRYRLDASTARRTLRLVQALPKYPLVAAALDDTASVEPRTDLGADGADQEADADADADADAEADADADAEADAGPVVGGWLLRPGQAEAIVSALERVPAHVPVEDRDAAERQLVGLAAHLSPVELRQAGTRMRDVLDTDGPEPEEAKAAARESLTLTAAERGVKFRGYLANENAELFRALIHAGARPHKTVDGEQDPRSREKRQADALSTTLSIAAAAADSGYLPPHTPNPARDNGAEEGGTVAMSGGVPVFGARAQLTVTIDFQDLKAAATDACGRLVYGDGLSAATVRRLACDAKVIPVVLGTNSEPLDVGRSERLVTRAMRRALNARDHGCVVCGAPPVMCEAHHLISWIDGGVTAVDNLVLLCRRHHADLHAGRWAIAIINNQVQVARPAWSEPPPTTHRRLRAPRRAPDPVDQPPTAGRPATGPQGGSPSASDAVVSMRRHSRWKADEAILREAAAFALSDAPAS